MRAQYISDLRCAWVLGEYLRLTEGDMDRFLARMRMAQDVDVDFSPARIDAHVPDL